MTYAYLKKYSPRTDKHGFYIDGPNWTLQTSPKLDRFFRQSTFYHDDTELPLTVVKTIVYLGEAETGDRDRKAELLDWFPVLNPAYCDMDRSQLAELRDFITKSLETDGLDEDDFRDFNDFLRHQTPIDPI